MIFQYLVTAAQKYFPSLQIKYKDQSVLMKFLSVILFFDKDFMARYATTFGYTIYFPSQHFTKLHPISSAVILFHELARLYGLNKKEAYLSSLYVIWGLSRKMHFNPHLEIEAAKFVDQLKKPWLSSAILEKQFQEAILEIKAGGKPYNSPIFDMLDDLICKV